MEKKQFVLNLWAVALIIFIPSVLKSDTQNMLIVWNVGQGQWVTQLEGDQCIHFDAGGEFIDWPAVLRHCGQRQNLMQISHWDADHINFIKSLSRQLRLCLDQQGEIGFASERKRKSLSRVEKCKHPSLNFWRWQPKQASNANSSSQVFVASHMLIAGDSPKHQEMIWSQRLPKPQNISVLILGHHGSLTSTSTLLLSKLTTLKMAVASAREAKYGHPHAQTKAALRQFYVALLTTEDWGSIAFEL